MDEKDIILKRSKKIKGRAVEGFDFNSQIDFANFFEKFETTGFQATQLYKASSIWKDMNSNKDVVKFLGFTSNVISCGLRDVVRWLSEHKKVDVMVTTAGGIEEDVVKVIGPFVMGSWNLDDVKLREDGINRTGNVLVPNDLYVEFEKYIKKLCDRLILEKQIWTPRDFIFEMGRELESYKNKHESYLYWAYKNKIPTFCMPLLDGSIGDMLYFYNKNKTKKLLIDISQDDSELKDIVINASKTGGIILGGGLPKHQVNNSNLFREGMDYAVYITTNNLWDGSVSGAVSSEGQSWGKVSTNARHTDVICDFTIAFPLLVYSVFYEDLNHK